MGREQEIVDAIVRGVSARKLAPDFKVSATVMSRWMGELEAKAAAAREKALEEKKASAAPMPAEPSSAPTVDESLDFTEATLAEIDRQLSIAKEKAEAASDIKNAEEHATYMRMIIALLEARRKATPAPKIDPNTNPDMLELAKQARAKLHQLADALVRVSKSPLADSIAAILRPKAPENEQLK